MAGEKKIDANTRLQDLVSDIDVSAIGVVSLADWKGTKLEETALRLLPQAHSVVVFAMEIYPEVLDLTSPGRTMGEASMNDLLARNADFINGRLTKAAYDVAKACHSIGMKALPLPATGCPYDMRFLESVFSFKHAGQAAGLGKIGWHSLLINSDFGSRVRLSCCLTEAALQPTNSNSMKVDCESCGLCLGICPAGAITEPQGDNPYALNKFACSSFCNASGGCSECMRICPMGR